MKKWILYVCLTIVSLAGAFVGSFIVDGPTHAPQAYRAIQAPNKAKIVRFSKHYACQRTDRACIANGINQFSGPSSGWLN